VRLILAGFVALLVALLAVAFLFRAKRSLIVSGLMGMVAGFMSGYVLAVVVSASHFFGPIRIPDPIIQIGGVAMPLSVLCAPFLGVVGLIVGCMLGARSNQTFVPNPANFEKTLTVNRRYITASMVSGCVWGAIGLYLGHEFMLPFIWGAFVASPLIGLAVGLLYNYLGVCQRSLVVRIIASLVTLYVAIALFGLAAGLSDALRPIPNRNVGPLVLQGINACVAGITVTGLILALWPLSFLNHSLLCRVQKAPKLQ
jgi:hypothetical protein